MKILILSFYYAPDLCAGSFRTTALVNELDKLEGVEVEVVTTMPNRYASFETSAPENESNGNVTIRRIQLPQHNSGMLDQIHSFYTYYRKAHKLVSSKQYDLVFATSSRLFTAFLGAKIAKEKELPLYLDIRDIFVDTIKDVLPLILATVSKPLLVMIERYTFQSATHLNLVSKGFEHYFKSRFKNPTYSWFTNGIDREFLDLPKVEVCNASDKVNILYAGNVGEGQGLHLIIPRLAKEIGEQYHITVVGDGGRHSQLKEGVEGMDNVTLLAPVKRTELVQKYMDADILFLQLNDYPAFEKVLPSKIFEYAATGKPILAGVSGYSASFIRDEVPNAEVFISNDASSAVDALKRLELNSSDRAAFISKYQRSNIMSKMAQSIVAMCDRHA